MEILFLWALILLALGQQHALAFSSSRVRKLSDLPPRHLFSTPDETETEAKASGVEEYRNAVTKVLSNFMQKESMSVTDPFSDIDFDAPKIPPKTSLETLAAALDYELIEKEWFVTGRVNPSYFSEDFEFQDPDVQLKGIEEYARGVYRLFNQETSRAEIISTVVNTTTSTPEKPIITCTWRLSGNVNIAFGLPIKPYIVYTDFVVDSETSLILFQEDRFGLPPWDILLSALFPALIGKITSPPAPSVEKRLVSMPNLKTSSSPPLIVPTFQPLEALLNFFDPSPKKS